MATCEEAVLLSCKMNPIASVLRFCPPFRVSFLTLVLSLNPAFHSRCHKLHILDCYLSLFFFFIILYPIYLLINSFIQKFFNLIKFSVEFSAPSFCSLSLFSSSSILHSRVIPSFMVPLLSLSSHLLHLYFFFFHR